MTDSTLPGIQSGWGDPPTAGGDADAWQGWLRQHSQAFDKGVNDLKAALDVAFDELKSKPDSPELLAKYQDALSAYNMYRMLQSNSIKSLGDQSKSVIRNLA